MTCKNMHACVIDIHVLSVFGNVQHSRVFAIVCAVYSTMNMSIVTVKYGGKAEVVKWYVERGGCTHVHTYTAGLLARL
jgi:hypothetical protein